MKENINEIPLPEEEPFFKKEKEESRKIDQNASYWKGMNKIKKDMFLDAVRICTNPKCNTPIYDEGRCPNCDE